MIRHAFAEVPSRAVGYVFAATAAAVADPHTLEIGTVYVVRVFGADIHLFPVLVSIFAMLAIRQLMRSRTESWREATVLTFALSLLLIATIVQFKLGVAYATGLGFGIGASGMAVVNLFKDGVVRYYKSLVDRFMKRGDDGTPRPPSRPRAPRRPSTPRLPDSSGSARALDDDVADDDTRELQEEIERLSPNRT